jgi:hypothetical protein
MNPSSSTLSFAASSPSDSASNLTDFLGDTSPSARGLEVERMPGPDVRAGAGSRWSGGSILYRMLVVSGESDCRRPPIAELDAAGVPMARDARRLGVLPSARDRNDIGWVGIDAGCSPRFEDDVSPCARVG